MWLQDKESGTCQEKSLHPGETYESNMKLELGLILVLMSNNFKIIVKVDESVKGKFWKQFCHGPQDKLMYEWNA